MPHGHANLGETTPRSVFYDQGRFGRLFPTLPRPGQGLVIAKSLYAELGGHRAEAPDPERDLLGRLGRSRLTTLRTTITDNI